MNCKNCGFPLNGNQVCPSCGTPVNSNENINVINEQQVLQNDVPVQTQINQINEPATTPIIQNNEPVIQNVAQEAVHVIPVSSDPVISSSNPKKKNVGLIIFFVIIGILIIGVGIFLGIKFLGDSSKSDSPIEATSTNEVEESQDAKAVLKTDVYITLDNMTSEEIVENVKRISNISDNNVAKNFTDRFILSGTDHYLQGTENSFGENPIFMFSSDAENAYISAVYVKNMAEATDGSITIADNSYIDTYLTITEETFAEDIYSSFKTMYSSIGTLNNEEILDNKYTADYEVNGLHYMLGLVTYGADYQLHVQIPVK